jgi:LPS sulfotransferase NodH
MGQSLREELRDTNRRFYCLCFAIRSGSTLLCADLQAAGLGAPTEYFQPRQGAPRMEFLGITAASLQEYLLTIVRRSPPPFFGFKISWEQAATLCKNLERECGLATHHDLRTVFPGLQFIHIRREQKALQAISAWRAVTSNVWHVAQGNGRPAPGREVAYDFEAIKPYFFQVVSEDWLWRLHFERLGVQPFTLCYEEYIRDRRGAVRAIAEYLGAVLPPDFQLSDTLAMMRDEYSLELERQFLEDLYWARHPMWVHADPPEVPDL